MIRLSGIRLSPDYKDEDIALAAARMLKIGADEIRSVRLHKLSVDARKKSDVHFIAAADVCLIGDERAALDRAGNKNAVILSQSPYCFMKSAANDRRVVVVGAGPAGLFAAYTLAKAGLRPLIIERGSTVDKRIRDVEAFQNGGELNENSNIQFGEGGAGTFSDGKLNTGIKDTRIRAVLEAFVAFGAPQEILWQAKPHIGTDILRRVIVNMRREIIRLGGEFRFDCRLKSIHTSNEKIVSLAVVCAGTESVIPCDDAVLAIGHSARDTFYSLRDSEVMMTQKPFSVGVRIEHPQSMIDRAQYGDFARCGRLGAADYKLAVHLPSGRGVYTFCMCPGGYVVAAASERESVVTNGMSNFSRDGENANSAVLVNVDTADLGNDVLSGVEFQRKIERAAYRKSGGYSAPAETLNSFLYGGDNAIRSVVPTYRPNVNMCGIGGIFPPFVTDSLREGILLMGKKLRGFADKNAVITAPETRSSSPVRILRGDGMQSLSVAGLYPCGEGAGYAGGITSAAVDGIKCAESIIAKYNEQV